MTTKKVWLPDRHTDGQTDAGQSDPYVPLCFAGDTIIVTWRVYPSPRRRQTSIQSGGSPSSWNITWREHLVPLMKQTSVYPPPLKHYLKRASCPPDETNFCIIRCIPPPWNITWREHPDPPDETNFCIIRCIAPPPPPNHPAETLPEESILSPWRNKLLYNQVEWLFLFIEQHGGEAHSAHQKCQSEKNDA